ncbi:MAG: bifunctional phosphoribosyl-AMP cyclohydrolase/phosphoribosyl-ATP diphosphatase HisIE [Acidobacteriota bacterium]
MIASQLDWEKTQGLIPAVVQDAQSGRVLMLAFMNSEALEKTLETGFVTFWSRSRNSLWTKGETSGNYLKLQEIRQDCDNDALLVIAVPEGPACHRGSLSCFGEDSDFTALEFLSRLEQVISERKKDMPEGSYTTRLFQKGMAAISQKVGEEAVEVVVSAGQEKQRSVEETADLFYHLLVFLSAREIRLSDVIEELARRHAAPGPEAHHNASPQ